MDIEDWIVVIGLFMGLPLAVGLYGKYRRKWEIDDTIRYAAVTMMDCLLIILTYICLFEETIPQDVVNKYTILSINFAIGALITTYYAQISQKRTVTDLHHDIDKVCDNTRDIMQDDLDIMRGILNLTTHIKQLEESQQALADQIQSLKDSIPQAKPSDEPHDDEDLTGSLTDKRDY